MSADPQTIELPCSGSPDFKGFVKIWRVDPNTGSKDLVVDKNNTILKDGATIFVQALAGAVNSKISHIYIGYNNTEGTFTPPAIDKDYSIKFSNYGSGAHSTYGYLRLPLAYNPSFIGTPGYQNNVAVFTGIVSSSGNSHGAPFVSAEDASSTNPASQIFEIALVAANENNNVSSDRVFSRANFVPLVYNSSYNLTVAWGIRALV